MTELIYELHYQGVFDNGSSDIRLIAKFFESTFNFDLGNLYQTYLELRTRKMSKTKFLDALRDGLIKKMDDRDENFRFSSVLLIIKISLLRKCIINY
ncbi:RteC domain-containing protein [Arenibacter amylolyticus]|uniref:RteC domain-containing protein n=1 Tax=Arenibacter amylolyticus TaxID=1406873 RepID=UPI001FEA4D0C|nr:RteC domain-containing protein [Arenibacter amylolyticus]